MCKVKVVFKVKFKIVLFLKILLQIVKNAKTDFICNKVNANNMKIKLFVIFIHQLKKIFVKFATQITTIFVLLKYVNKKQ